MHVLVTADTMSGAWTYTRELVTGLVTRGVRVTLVTFGEIPLPDQTAWMELLHGLEFHPTAFRLEWMDDAPRDLPESSEFLANLVREVRPDLLHLHQFCHATLPVDVPRVVMAHGDVITWTQAVQGCAPRPTRWLKWYRDTIVRGIAAADAVVAPSTWMLETIRTTYTRPGCEAVIYPGRNPIFFNPYVSKDDSVLSVGRLLDAGKQVLLLTQHAQPFSVCIVGAEQAVPLPRIPIRADVKVSTDPVPDAVLYDWDFLPPGQREGLCAELCEQPVGGVVAVHGYNISESETQALQRSGVLVFPRLIPHVIGFLRRLVGRSRAAQ